VQWDLSGIEGHAPAGAEAGGVRVNALEVIQPKPGRIVARIILHQDELRPAHGPVIPTTGHFRRCFGLSGQGRRGTLRNELPSIRNKLLRLRDDANVGLRRSPAAGILLARFFFGNRRQNNHVIARIPVSRRGYLVRGGQLHGIEDAQ